MIKVLHATKLIKNLGIPDSVVIGIADFVGFHPFITVCLIWEKLIKLQQPNCMHVCQVLADVLGRMYTKSVGILLSHHYARDDLVKRRLLRDSDQDLYSVFGETFSTASQEIKLKFDVRVLGRKLK